MWETSGLHRMRLEVSDSEGASSGTYERWVNVANVPPVVQPLGEVLPLAEGEEIRLVGNATDTPSDYDSLIRCWDVDPGIDSNDIGGADDDCDVLVMSSYGIGTRAESIPSSTTSQTMMVCVSARCFR